MPRIVIIGGGSYTWGPTFVRDILTTPALRGCTLVLHDIDPARVDLVYRLGQRMLADFDVDCRLEQTTSLAEALGGADFVILTITTGGFESMRPDLQIPTRYGIKQAVGDTTGPGGLSRALRNIPVVAQIARRVNEICPNAFFLNYTNPMSTLTRAIDQARSVDNRTVGLCHEWHGVRAKLAAILGVDEAQIQPQVAGINHLIWLTGLRVAGQDVWDVLPGIAGRILSGELDPGVGDDTVFVDRGKVKARLFQLYRALPVAGDRHVAEFFPHFITKATGWGAQYGFRLTSIEDRQAIETWARTMIESAMNGDMPLSPFMAERSGEAAAEIAAAVSTGGRYVGILNLPNAGQIANLPLGAVVETYGVIDATGARAITFGALPPGVQAVLERHVRSQEMTVTAALTGSRELALQVLLNDPLSSRLTVDQAEAMLEELLRAHRPHLPLFFDESK